jgi:ferredoxin
MGADVYVRLGERMNRFEGRYPLVDAYMKVLQVMCTEEEADFASKFPEKALTLDALSKMYGKDPSVLIPLLDTMAWKGLLYTETSEKGDRTYSLNPILPGAMEYYILRRLDKPDEIKAYMELYNNMHVEAKVFLDKLMEEDPEKAKTFLPTEPIFRTVPVNEALPDKKSVHAYEDILKMIDKHSSFSAMLCTCKEGIGPNTTGPCKVQNIPRHHCLMFGKGADYAIEQKIGDARRITKEECLEILESCNKAGLVQNVNNFVDDLQFICNCCSCCCGIVQSAKLFGPAQAGIVETTNFFPVVDQDLCTGCGECAEKCPVAAISLKDDTANINRDQCLGCGFCATVCPVGSIALERVSDKKLELGQRKVGFGFGG